MKKFLKVLHTLGSIGLMGGLGCYLVLAIAPLGHSALEAAAVRQSIAAFGQWLILPSLPVVLVSGLLAMAAHPPFINANWVWLKLATGVVMFEGTLGVLSRATSAAKMAALVAAGSGDAAAFHELVRRERWGVWTVLFVAFANVVIGIWRPRFRARSERLSDRRL